MTSVNSKLNVIDTVASQYANSPTILQLIESFRQCVDPSPDFENFYNQVWNIDTAQGFGLDILGRILGISRQVDVPAIYPVTVAPGPFSLPDERYRALLYAKALANITATSSPEINRVLRLLFPNRGNTFVDDQGNMHMRYRFLFSLDGYEFAIMLQGAAIPRPAGVKATLSTIQPYFGFSEADSWASFDEQSFASY